MQTQLWNNRNLIIVVGLVVLMALWFWYSPMTSMMPTMMNGQMEEAAEGFNGEEMPHDPNGEMAMEEAVPDKNHPFVNPETGALLDGPGFEKGEVEGVSQEVRENIPSNYYFLDDGAGGEMSIQHNLCSKSCCSEQWPTPFKQKYDPYVCGSKDKFSSSGYFCSNSFQNSGLIARSE